VRVLPLSEGDGVLGVAILFEDVTDTHRVRTELQRSSHELETAYEELQSANEELETTNEELQSAVEELQTTNEELQSTNEEHETMNEELQATNEELQTLNEELGVRTDELNRANAFLGSILSSLRAGVAVLDRSLNVLMWNDQAEELWGVRSDEVQGHSFMELDIGLPLPTLVEALRTCLAGRRGDPIDVDATNRRGRSIKCRVTCTPLLDPGDSEVQGAIILMESASP
jgi:two-component system CheB/CheR fusion protein